MSPVTIRPAFSLPTNTMVVSMSRATRRSTRATPPEGAYRSTSSYRNSASESIPATAARSPVTMRSASKGSASPIHPRSLAYAAFPFGITVTAITPSFNSPSNCAARTSAAERSDPSNGTRRVIPVGRAEPSE